MLREISFFGRGMKAKKINARADTSEANWRSKFAPKKTHTFHHGCFDSLKIYRGRIFPV